MPISENQLDTWSKRGPTAQFTATYESLRSCLTQAGSPYAARGYTIFLQGSYKNETNIYADSDVDIIMRLDDVYYTDLDQLPEEDKAAYNAARSDASYSLQQFKTDVTAWLKAKYGSDVQPGSKAIFVKGNGARRDADVLACARLRRYHRFKSWNDSKYVEGVCFFLPSGARIDNFPIQHHDNCTAKHQNTREWFKRTVRIYKNLRNTMVDKGLIPDGLAPSYFLEGMLYNVDTSQFGGTQQANFADTLNWLNKADRSKFLCANEMYFLLNDHSPVTWRAEKCSQFLSAVIGYWNAA